MSGLSPLILKAATLLITLGSALAALPVFFMTLLFLFALLTGADTFDGSRSETGAIAWFLGATLLLAGNLFIGIRSFAAPRWSGLGAMLLSCAIIFVGGVFLLV